MITITFTTDDGFEKGRLMHQLKRLCLSPKTHKKSATVSIDVCAKGLMSFLASNEHQIKAYSDLPF